jgi:hypothetical protein
MQKPEGGASEEEGIGERIESVRRQFAGTDCIGDTDGDTAAGPVTPVGIKQILREALFCSPR